MFERTAKEWDRRTRQPVRGRVRGKLWTWTDCPESPWIPNKENVTDNGLHIGSVAEAKRKDLLNYDSRFIGQLSDITLLLSLSKCLWVIIRLKLWPVTFGKVIWTSDSESLEMNKMHLIEKTFIRNRFEVYGHKGGRVINTYGRFIRKIRHPRGRLWECHKVR